MPIAPAALVAGLLAVGSVAVVSATAASSGISVAGPESVRPAFRTAAPIGRASGGGVAGRAGPPSVVGVGGIPSPRRPAPAGRFRWPLVPAPTVLRRFAVGPAPWSPGHRGVDLAATGGQKVLAAGDGAVAFAGSVAGVGVVVVVHAGGLRTTYQPVAATVRVRQRVVAGDALGTVAAWPGHCAGPCLHWGALRGDAYVDPLTLLGLGPPVLLPLGP